MADVPLNPMPQMSQVPQNQMPVTYQVPLNQMPQMSQLPPYQMSQVPPYQMSHIPQNQMAQMPQNQMPLMSQVPLNQMRPMTQVALGPEPCTVTCPSCGASILTAVTLQPSTQTHLVALLLCCFCICLACLPYCMDSCQNSDHHCPECDAYLGTFHR